MRHYRLQGTAHHRPEHYSRYFRTGRERGAADVWHSRQGEAPHGKQHYCSSSTVLLVHVLYIEVVVHVQYIYIYLYVTTPSTTADFEISTYNLQNA